jgi:hypothetical protein
MIRTVIIAETEDISIHLPKKYVGKKLEVFLYAVDELTDEKASKKTFGNSGLMGSLHLTDKEYNDFQQHAKDIRNEWDKDI